VNDMLWSVAKVALGELAGHLEGGGGGGGT